MKLMMTVQNISVDSFAPRIRMMFEDGFARTTSIAACRAIDNTLSRARDAEMRHMQQVFKSPTPYTIDSLRVIQTRNRVPVGSLLFAIPRKRSQTYLAPEIFGGPRKKKGLEVAMSMKFNGRFFVPSHEYLKRYGDEYGNIPGGQIKRLIAALGAGKFLGEESGRQDANKKSARGSQGSDFVYISGYRAKRGRRPPGIYQRGVNDPDAVLSGRARTAAVAKGGRGAYQAGKKGAVRARALRLIMYEIKQPTYKPLFPYDTFVDITRKEAMLWMPKYFNDAFVADVANKGWRR